MKKIFYIFFVIIFIFFNFCGCVITEKEIKTKDCFNLSKYNIKIVVPKFISQELEELAQDFENSKKNVKVEVIRIEDDVLYRKRVLDEILSNDASLFFVHGEKDVSFFKDVIEKFNLSRNKNRVLMLNNLPVFQLDIYFSGIWFNPKILSNLKIDENKIKSFRQFIQLIENLKKINFLNKKTDFLEIGDGIYPLILSCNFLNGEICDDFEYLLKYLKDERKDINLTLLSGEKIFYIGDNRRFNSSLKQNGEENLKCVYLPIGGNNKILKEEDYICMSRKITKYDKEIVVEFLEFIADKTKGKFLNNSDGYFTFQEVAPGFIKCLKEHFKMLKQKSLNFKDMKRKVKGEFLKYKTLDENF